MYGVVVIGDIANQQWSNNEIHKQSIKSSI